jgi:serine/threonine protein kinase
MASHDFASTYVGTPFYMSPEICAAEQYSLFSDIWAFGCIMYELCSREPPFNAKTHLELIQKIRLGKIKPLSSVYSRELQETIASCLRVNPHSRPDTSQLLNLPMVKLKRKEMEVVALGKQLKARDEQIARKEMELDHQLNIQSTYRESIRAELDASLHRQWEVKARLEIDRQVQLEVQRLRKDWDGEIDRRVKAEIQRLQIEALPPRSSTPNPDDVPEDIPFLGEYRQSQAMYGEAEFDESPDMSELSMESPTMQRVKNPKAKRPSSRTPFTRAQTMFEHQDSPADISMAEPSPAPIASLNLSPRRTSSKASGLSRNLFANMTKSNRSTPSSTDAGEQDDLDDGDDTDGFAVLPSPVGKKRRSTWSSSCNNKRAAERWHETDPLWQEGCHKVAGQSAKHQVER